jgi:8-hydroxy-5-deazaflavin:NADPH oxidoreductase
MKIATIGRGNIGGGLGSFWEQAGHEVTRLGKEGGDVSDVDVVLVAVPGGAIADALDKVTGLEGKTAIDATNLVGADRPAGFNSNAEYVKSKTGGPTAKSFNLNFAAIFDRVGKTTTKPSNVWTGDEEAREVVEQLIRDAGYDPVCAGGLENARMQEDALALLFSIVQAGAGRVFYRFAPADEF